MRKLSILTLAVVLPLSSAACRCSPAAEQAAVEIEDTQKIVLQEYKSYVEKDPALDADKKARRKALIESLERLVQKLRKVLEE